MIISKFNQIVPVALYFIEYNQFNTFGTAPDCRPSDRSSIGTGGFTNDKFTIIHCKISPRDILPEIYGGKQMARRINQSRVKTKQIPYQMREKDASVFAVAIGVIKRLLSEKSPVASPHLVVKLIDQRSLYPVEQPVGSFQ